MLFFALLLGAGAAYAASPVASNVTISGQPEVGVLLTGNYVYSDADGDLEGVSLYAWIRYPVFGGNCVQIFGSTVSSQRQYTPGANDEGDCLVFQVTPVAQTGAPGEFQGSPARSPFFGPIGPANTAPTATNVSISGETEVGFTLTGSYTYNDADGDSEGTSTFRWLRDGGAISGANGLQYVLVAADEGATIRFEVTPVAQSGVTVGNPAQSGEVGPIRPANTAPVASDVEISGTPEAGYVLQATYDYDDADNDPEGPSVYRWIRGNATIPGATGTQYTLVAADVGTNIRFEVTPVAQSGVTTGIAVQSNVIGPIRPANTPPVASNVQISGDIQLGATVNGTYTYTDADGDAQGASEFRWLRGGSPINGATAQQYTIVAADVGNALQFEVTPVAQSGVLRGAPVLSAPANVDNEAPVIQGQDDLETEEDTALTLTVDDFDIDDPDSDPDDFALSVQDGTNYTHQGNTITPAEDFNGVLTVPVRVSDGFEFSAVFNASVTVTPVNDRPVITAQVPSPFEIEEDTSVTLGLASNFIVDDPDDMFPDDFVLALLEGDNYSVAGLTVTPAENYNGLLFIGAEVTDAGGLTSQTFTLTIDVGAVNDEPTLVAPIEDLNAVENSPVNYSVAANFDDADGDPLVYSAEWSPAAPPNLAFDGDAGVLSGTPTIADAESPGPIYGVTITATDPDGEVVSDTFELIVSALDRANLALDIVVNPSTGNPGDEFQWTFTTSNPVGPQAGSDVLLEGQFTATSLVVTPVGGAACTTEDVSSQVVAFACQVGDVPVGGTPSLTLSTTSADASEIFVVATATSANSVPIDPNPADNTDLKAVGTAGAFSLGAAQSVGSASVLSLDSGDVNGDGVPDVVVGTSAGTAVQIYLADAERESCDCQRDFVATPISLPSTGSARGVRLADFDNDGALDLVIATGGGQADTVYRNTGNGNFAELIELELSSANAVAVADFDNDGNLDIAIAADGPNLVYLGDGAGGFTLESTIGDGPSMDVVAGRIDADALPDLVFANSDGASRIYLRRDNGGFRGGDQFSLGGVNSVALGDLDGDGANDLVFGRGSVSGGQVPSNPVYLNNGNGGFNTILTSLGISPTNDVQIGDVSRDGSPDLVFVNASGVHQVWKWDGSDFVLHDEQIIDLGALVGLLGNFGEVATDDAGGIDLVMAGAVGSGIGVYLNDGLGNLGRGDNTVPVLELVGDAAVEIPSGSAFTDPGATALDDIDGDISGAVVASGNVNTAVVGQYTVTYNVSDFAGNAAEPITRSVRVNPATGAGGGGGGSLSAGLVALLLGMLIAGARYRRVRHPGVRNKN